LHESPSLPPRGRTRLSCLAYHRRRGGLRSRFCHHRLTTGATIPRRCALLWPDAKAPHETPPPCPRPPGLDAPPAIAWDSACDRSLAAASSLAGGAVSPPPASPLIVRWRSPAWLNAPRVCLRAPSRSLCVPI